MFNLMRGGLVAAAVGAALVATTAFAAEGHRHGDVGRAIRDMKHAERAIQAAEHGKHPDKALDRALAWERRADRLLDKAGVKDGRLDQARDELREAETAVDQRHPEIAEAREKAAEQLLDQAIRQAEGEAGS